MVHQDHTFHYKARFTLESGESLPGFQLRFTTVGALNREKSNVIWVCHALTGNSNVLDWWPDLFAGDSPFDPSKYFIICANVPGGCYGSTGPLSVNPDTGSPWYHEFPTLTVRDIVGTLDILRQHLGIDRIHTLIGGSLGGQQVLEWAIQSPDVFEHLIPIACNAFHSPWGIAFNESQRMAIEADQTWKENDPRAGAEGLKAARAIGMISYRHYETYRHTQSEKTAEVTDAFRAASYQRYQGTKLSNRFNAFTYWTLSKAMDSHHVGRHRESIGKALGSVKARTMVVGIDSDILFPVQEQQLLADLIPGATLEVITSLYGHDGFLVECQPLKETIKHFLLQSQKEITV